jgi:hypothetical protein
VIHPLVLEELVHAREADIARAVARPQPPTPAKPHLHERLGWFLIGTGLRLAVGRRARVAMDVRVVASIAHV